MSKHIFSLELQYPSCSRSAQRTISALAPDFSQHGNMRAVSQDMANKVTGITYLKKYLGYFILNKKNMRYLTSYLKKVSRI